MVAMLLIGGAPRLQVDAVRYLSVRASGGTVLRLVPRLVHGGCAAAQITTLLPAHLQTSEHGLTTDTQWYETRAELDAAVKTWVQAHPQGLVLSSAAVNDYEVREVHSQQGDTCASWEPGEKVPSGADELRVVLRPAPKLIDTMRGDWGHEGPLVAFKFEDSDTVIASAQRLLERVDARVVVANSLCGRLQALVFADRVQPYPDRAQLEAALADTIVSWSHAAEGDLAAE